MVFKVGDPDTTTHADFNVCCDVEEDEWGFICTRKPSHDGQHAAGDGFRIVHVW